MAEALRARLVSSQKKLFPETEPETLSPLSSGAACRNEPYNFQLILRRQAGGTLPVSVSVSGTLRDGTKLPVSAYRVGYVPVTNLCNPNHEEGYDVSPSMRYPDPLFARPAEPEIVSYPGLHAEKDTLATVNLADDASEALWFCVNEDRIFLPAGEGTLTVRVTSLADLSILWEGTLPFTVLPAVLPENRAYYTNWFYCDCLADTYGVELWSERFWEIFRKQVRCAARHGMNTLLTPCFTPPLDTPVGGTRMPVQLVDITVTEDGYRFDFARLHTYITIARECGIVYFEHCHLFSQWGAEHAPAVYAETKDGFRRIFGWETDASGAEYKAFLHAYLPAFRAFAEQEGIADKLIFHISDEPSAEHEASYRRAVETVGGLLDGCIIADALSEYRYYEQGLVRTPIAGINRADDFVGKCGHFWLYYTGGPYYHNCPNRLITNTAARTRMLGVMLYACRAEGFLHWGYNYYYDRMSQGRFHPLSDPCGYKRMPGATYLCYPAENGDCIPSLREFLMQEAFCDCAALSLLEEKIGRDAVLVLCEEVFGAPANQPLVPADDALLRLREKVNALFTKA